MACVTSTNWSTSSPVSSSIAGARAIAARRGGAGVATRIGSSDLLAGGHGSNAASAGAAHCSDGSAHGASGSLASSPVREKRSASNIFSARARTHRLSPLDVSVITDCRGRQDPCPIVTHRGVDVSDLESNTDSQDHSLPKTIRSQIYEYGAATRRADCAARGLPEGYRMRADTHYVEHLSARGGGPLIRSIPTQSIDGAGEVARSCRARPLDPIDQDARDRPTAPRASATRDTPSLEGGSGSRPRNSPAWRRCRVSSIRSPRPRPKRSLRPITFATLHRPRFSSMP